jgi:hypothetical protein
LHFIVTESPWRLWLSRDELARRGCQSRAKLLETMIQDCSSAAVVSEPNNSDERIRRFAFSDSNIPRGIWLRSFREEFSSTSRKYRRKKRRFHIDVRIRRHGYRRNSALFGHTVIESGSKSIRSVFAFSVGKANFCYLHSLLHNG